MDGEKKEVAMTKEEIDDLITASVKTANAVNLFNTLSRLYEKESMIVGLARVGVERASLIEMKLRKKYNY